MTSSMSCDRPGQWHLSSHTSKGSASHLYIISTLRNLNDSSFSTWEISATNRPRARFYPMPIICDDHSCIHMYNNPRYISIYVSMVPRAAGGGSMVERPFLLVSGSLYSPTPCWLSAKKAITITLKNMNIILSLINIECFLIQKIIRTLSFGFILLIERFLSPNVDIPGLRRMALQIVTWCIDDNHFMYN